MSPGISLRAVLWQWPMLIIGADDEVAPKLDLGEKIRELCEALLQDEGVTDARKRIEGFMNNPTATAAYQRLANMNNELHQKESSGTEISEPEIEAFQKLREEVMEMPAVQEFADARQTLQEIESTIMTFVGRTMEMGKIPSDKDMGGSCGSGCGCH